MTSPVKNFIKHHYRHFNAAALVDAAEGYQQHINSGGKMLVSLAGAMSTAELGLSLSEMIRCDKVHIISCTGANLEEDLFNLVAHNFYRRIPNYRELTPQMERQLREHGLNRVTDTCIPEEEAMRRLEKAMWEVWGDAAKKNERYFPYQYFYQILESGVLKSYYQIDPKNSWVMAACEKKIPIITPGYEDSTLANMFVAAVRAGKVARFDVIKSGLEQMSFLIDWYQENSSPTVSKGKGIGFFQIGGGIAGDFPICVVPLIRQDLEIECPFWGYFCQISDSTTSFGSYSGAVPNEKITWEKLDIDTPRFIVESDATIVAPLVFAYVLGW